MKFLSLTDRTGTVETERCAETYKSYGLATARYPVLEVEALANSRGFNLRVLRAGKPRSHRGFNCRPQVNRIRNTGGDGLCLTNLNKPA